VRVFAFIDTNVLLHYRFFDEVDWAAQLGADDVTLVFAQVVFDELDRHKWAGTHKEKRRAQAVLKKIQALKLSGAAVNVRTHADVMGLDIEPENEVFARYRLQLQSADDRLLASLLMFREADPSARVALLSPDVGCGIKARKRQIEVVEPDEALALADEPDEIEKELEKTKRELARMKSAAPNLRLVFAGIGTHASFKATLVRPFNYREIDRLADAWRKRHPHVAALPDAIAGLGGGITAKALRGFPFMTEEEAKERNAENDRVLSDYLKFLKAWPEAQNGLRRILPFNLVLENTGTAPADDVDVELRTEARGRWLEEPPELPAPPQMPKRRGPFDFGIDPVALSALDTLPRNAFINPALNEDGPNISGKDGDQGVQYTVRRVKHYVPCILPVVYFQFDSDEDIASFTVQVRLVAANITEPAERTLDVEVVRAELAEPSAPPAEERAED
jgi:hypothetical protein